jgi:hypothetical protein
LGFGVGVGLPLPPPSPLSPGFRHGHGRLVGFFELASHDPFGDCDWVRADSRGIRVAQRFLYREVSPDALQVPPLAVVVAP